ncbi:MAG: ribulokinase [Chitinophagaceae bacterium]
MYCIGLDFGTDSVRAVLADVQNGKELASAVFEYPRWKAGLYCDAAASRFRQHPLDYVEGMEYVIRACMQAAGSAIAGEVLSISITTTGSTPVAVDEMGSPLALLPGMEEDPDAMFFLWKDHTAIKEADEINERASAWPVDYLKYAGGLYSSEWFWAKMLHALRNNTQVREQSYTWVEHCDWMPFLLTGGKRVADLKRNVCAAGHKALWADEHEGFPAPAFFKTVDPLLEPMAAAMHRKVYSANESAGMLTAEWAERLGLSTTVKVGIGAIDAHVGAIGAQIETGFLTRIMGTSTCDMLVVPKEEFEGKFIKGICGQVDGSIIPGMIGLEAGQSAFGDVYSWMRNLLLWPLHQVPAALKLVPADTREAIADGLLKELDRQAAQLLWNEESPLAVDWFNGRRTPDVNLLLKGAITQLSLGTDAPRVYAALVEATCFGSKRIVERFAEEGVVVNGIIAAGGIPHKSSFVMQTLADVLNMEIRVSAASQICAAGAAMLAATVAGVYTDVPAAMKAMGAGFCKTYYPDPQRAGLSADRYARYKAACGFLETDMDR